MTREAADLRDRIVQLHAGLSRLPDLDPGPHSDPLFTELVRLCLRTGEPTASAVLAEPRVRRLLPTLSDLCADGETRLERAWAARVLSAPDPVAELARFPYRDNYRQLARMEVHALAGAGHAAGAGSRVCFLGGGPLPLSALELHRRLGVPVVVVDRDEPAARLAQDVLQRVAPETAIEVRVADGTSPGDMELILADCDVVVLAALVGSTRPEKRAVLSTVGKAMAPGSFLLARSAHGLRTLLYPPVEIEDVTDAAGCVPQLLVHPLGDVVNSVLVARSGTGRPAAPLGAG